MITVRDITGDIQALKEAFLIRNRVFVLEHGVDPAAESDGRDEDSRHFLASHGGVAVGAARVRSLAKGSAKLERMAILPGYRQRSVGSALLKYIKDSLALAGVEHITIHAQAAAKPFYEKHGFAVSGDVFYEQNLLHYAMRLKLLAPQEQALLAEGVA